MILTTAENFMNSSAMRVELPYKNKSTNTSNDLFFRGVGVECDKQILLANT